MAGQAEAIIRPKPAALQLDYIQASREWEAAEIKRLNDLVEEKEKQRQEAERQRRIAVAGKLAAESELTRTQSAELLERSVLLAVESLRRWPSAEADLAVRRGLGLLPQLVTRPL